MNALANKINNEFSGQCNISANPEKLKFNAIFEEEQLDEEIPEDMKEELKKLGIEDDEEIQENENIKGKKTVMQIKIFESQNGGYLLRFVRKEGDQNDYLEKMSKIYSLVKQN